ncbi:hypothetical protein CCACVL1_24480 [Corchorus capsularis]|uniref:DUF4283 domain-containing protein n=1 Tax=Corchorus capsularis TaxID=210143 RepID=A0A1R3GPF5_COCAP|nr:hypothetical protein CCACVL1_24480 [Corchorus capsularis]
MLSRKGVMGVLRSMWSEVIVPEIRELVVNTYSLRFASDVQKKKALEEGPWSIMGTCLVLKEWKQGIGLDENDFSEVEVWGKENEKIGDSSNRSEGYWRKGKKPTGSQYQFSTTPENVVGTEEDRCLDSIGGNKSQKHIEGRGTCLQYSTFTNANGGPEEDRFLNSQTKDIDEQEQAEEGMASPTATMGKQLNFALDSSLPLNDNSETLVEEIIRVRKGKKKVKEGFCQTIEGSPYIVEFPSDEEGGLMTVGGKISGEKTYEIRVVNLSEEFGSLNLKRGASAFNREEEEYRLEKRHCLEWHNVDEMKKEKKLQMRERVWCC